MTSKALNILFKSPITNEMIQFLCNAALRVIPCGKNTNVYPSPTSSPEMRDKEGLPSLMTFITKLVRYTNVYTGTLLTTAVYLNKLQDLLPRDAVGIPSTIHRIFLTCLIISAKYHNDSSPLNKYWCQYTDGLFTLRDINLMERQLLKLFQWNVKVEESDLLQQLSVFVDRINKDLDQSFDMKVKLVYERNQSVCSSTSTLNSLMLPRSSSMTGSYQSELPRRPRGVYISDSDSEIQDILDQYSFIMSD